MKNDKAPAFTDAQKLAINTRGKDILVSAGAGSGKTTVLTKRLIERIKSGDSVTEFLVVTFMSSAAADVKRKLYDALLKESASDPYNKHIYRQMLLISEADICTISSFCLGLVKENFALLGISPRVRVLDETEAAMIQRRIAEGIVEKGYEDENPSFLTLSDNFADDKGDDSLIERMLKLYSALRVTLGWKQMLLDCADGLRKEAAVIRDKGFFECESGMDVREHLKELYDELCVSCQEMYDYAVNVATDDCYLGPIQAVLDICTAVRNSLDDNYVNFTSAAYESTLKITLASKGCEKGDRDIIGGMKKAIVKEERALYDRYCRGNEEYIAASYEKCADIVCAIRDFLISLESGYDSAKLEAGVLDYTDFEQKTLQLLETTDENGNSVPTELCLKKQQRFKEILIDEYQDVNPMQDRIFTLLAGKSHRFMVGDVKQSIYKFRNAYPDIFLGYKERYADASVEASKNARIFLRENFRCADPVIKYVNHLFENVTSGTPYEREYSGEWLIHTDGRSERGTPVVLAIADKQPKMAKEARQAEADFIAREIIDLVNNHPSDNGSPYKYSDFAVMLSAMKGYSIEFEKAFQKYGIPYKKEKSENFLENPDIRLAVSALKAIDDPTDDISLCALMRSPICNFTSDDLYRIRSRMRSVPFWNAVAACTLPVKKRLKGKRYSFKTSRGSRSLCIRCREFIKRILAWRAQSAGVPCCDFLKSFFVSSGMMRISVSSGSRASLLLLYDYSRKFETAQNYGLSGFLDYLTELSANGKNISDAAKSGEEDAVYFITVHKSKGLEFKVCFVACANREFQGMKEADNINFLSKKGVYFRLRDRVSLTTYDPMCNILAVDKERESILGEELRKLYVALTRAKERLYMTGCAPVGWEDKKYSVSSAKSWLDLAIYVHQLGEAKFFDLRRIDDSEVGGGFLASEARAEISPREEMLDIIAFEYPYSASVSTAAKISVSELREGLLEDDEYNRTHLSVPTSRVSLRPAYISQKTVDAGEIGTANHLFMQFCDFDKAETDVCAEAARLLSNRMLTKEQFDMLDFASLGRFFGGDLYMRIKNSPRVFREKRFSVRDVLSENGEPILVQGVIDCFFENLDGSFTVVDYKTDRVKKYDELVARHRVQLACYRSAVERMTGGKVSQTLLYSFHLGGSVEVK